MQVAIKQEYNSVYRKYLLLISIIVFVGLGVEFSLLKKCTLVLLGFFNDLHSHFLFILLFFLQPNGILTAPQTPSKFKITGMYLGKTKQNYTLDMCSKE